ncbi:MAG TPA: hypothetical protein VMD79_07520 [Solirubrobacteraceae bacterium]|nr:hypothetical protein [Solirubrobacteraceae bacterium]
MTLDAGFDVCVVGKPGEEDPNDFGISGSGPGGRLVYREVSWFVGAPNVDDLPSDVQDRIASQEPLLITGSLRGGITQRYGFIVDVVRRRPRGAETIVLACENAPHQDYEKVREACDQTGALMLDTVVNRMCLELPRDSEHRRIVSAHRLGEWLVAKPVGRRTSKILQAMDGIEGFESVDDIEARHDRKLWMVNGAHQALALMARRANADHRLEDCDDLRQSLHDPVTAARLGHIHNAMNEALRIRHPHLTGSIQYSIEHVAAYAEHPDSVARVLSAYRRLQLMPFLDALDERIATPARICYEHDLSVEPFSHVINVFLELVANVDSFEDNIAARKRPIAVSADIELVERFGAMLTPWAGSTIEKQAGHFAQLLADHREAYES